MSNPQILCVGEILFDCLADQLGRDLKQVSSWTNYPGGAPANVASALMKLGLSAAFIGCVGEDNIGDELVNVLQEIGVNTRGIQRHPTAPTRKVYVTRSLTGERHFAGFGNFKTEEFADTKLEAEKLEESLFIKAKYLVIGTLLLGHSRSKKAIFKAIELAKKYNLTIVVDVNWRPVFWQNIEIAKPLIMEVLKEADFIKLSQEEAIWLFNLEDAQKIYSQFSKIQGVLVTLGEKGCNYYLGKNNGIVEAFPVNVIDTTGAGDSFVAGFLSQHCLHPEKILTDTETAKKSIIYSNAVGALTTTKPGAIAAQPSKKTVEMWLKKQEN
ncbi:MAG: carbohydrate kinase [Crocosphaera sp.]|nr:carbohydrate kinase [Crocosphaera sp.]